MAKRTVLESTEAAPPSFRNLMSFRLHTVANLSERITEQYYRRHMDLSLPECRVIGATASHGTVSFKRVAADAHLEKSYASRVVSALVGRDVIERLANPSDSRSVLLRLTEHGRELHKRMYTLALELNTRMQRPFRRKQIDDFMVFLTMLGEQALEHGEDLVGSVEGWRKPPAELLRASDPEPHGGQSIELNRDFARQLHELLGAYLERYS